jgi:YesN/AraC family two-component response regulator
MRDGLKEILATVAGFELIGEAANGNEVLAALQRIQPDLLLMDMSMPWISGISLIEQVKHGKD